MGIHGDGAQYDLEQYPTNARGFAAGSALGKQRMAAAERDYGGAIRGTAPSDKNKRGQIEDAVENLVNNINVVVGLSERIHGTLLGFDPGSGGTVEGKASVPAGVLAQQLEVLHYLTSRVLDARHRLENVASEIGA